MSLPRNTLVALVSAAALALSGCSGESGRQHFTALPDEPTDTSASATHTAVADEETDSDKPVEVDPARFGDSNMFQVGLPGTGASGCFVSKSEQNDFTSFYCAVEFPPNNPVPRMTGEMNRANVVQYDPVVGFYPGYEFEAGEWQNPAVLEPNQTVELLGYRLTRIGDTLKVERGAHTVTVTGNVMEADSPGKHVDESNFTPDTSKDAKEGAVCGTVINALGTTSVVIAQEDGTDCKRAAEVAETYYKPDTPTQGSAGFWTSPDGWTCGRGYLAPGMEDAGVNKSTVCEADGKGSVAIPAQDDL